MKIRTFAESVGFEVVGKLRYMGKWDVGHRWYLDEDLNAYVVDTILGTIGIIPASRR